MPSYTSSSDMMRWLGAGFLALLVWAVGVMAYERYLRSTGHLPTVVDTHQLWAQERSRVYDDQALVFIGASRTLYGIDLIRLKLWCPSPTP